VSRGSIDVAAAPITITPERERLVDFSHIFYAASLGMAVAKQTELDRWASVFRALFTTGFLRILFVIALLLLLVGAAIWLFERRHNPGHFGGKPLAGIGSGFWFSSATLSGLSYGDKVPVTAGGRAVAIAWMLASLIVVAGFTAFVTSRLTISHFETVRGREDLPRLLVATVEGSPGEEYLRRERIQMRVYPTLPEAIGAVARRETDAVVYASAILKYVASHDYRGRIDVLPDVLEQQYFAFALPNGSRLREPLNIALLDVTAQPTWRQIQHRYLGE
jgi:ABC-type amino acid transport substrate-binding protein